MKFIILFSLLVFLNGCATSSPERLKEAEAYEKRSEAATQRAAQQCELPGTPDNVESMEKSNEEASVYRSKAHDAKYGDTFFSILFGIIFD